MRRLSNLDVYEFPFFRQDVQDFTSLAVFTAREVYFFIENNPNRTLLLHNGSSQIF